MRSQLARNLLRFSYFFSFFFFFASSFLPPPPFSLSLSLSQLQSHLRVEARKRPHGAVVDDDQRLRRPRLPRDGIDARRQAAPLAVGPRERGDDDDEDLAVRGRGVEALGHGVGGDPVVKRGCGGAGA